MKTGGWRIIDNKPCNLPQTVASGFTEIYGNRVGASFTPLLYAATQLVHGTNHLIICEKKTMSNPTGRAIVKVVLTESLPTEGGKFEELSCDVIVEE